MLFFNTLLPLCLLIAAAESAPTSRRSRALVEGLFSSIRTKVYKQEGLPDWFPNTYQVGLYEEDEYIEVTGKDFKLSVDTIGAPVERSFMAQVEGTVRIDLGGVFEGIRMKEEEERRKEEERQKEEDLKNGIYDRNGNFRLTFKKETITIGTIELDEIFQSLRNACHPTGNCETNDIVLKGQLIGEGTTTSVDNVELTLSPHGSYREAHLSSLLDLMESAVRQVAKCEEYSHKTPCPNPMVFCPSTSHRYTRCAVPAYWAVNLQKEEDKDEGSAPPTIETDLSLEVVDDTICEDWFDKLSEFGGMINGHAGDALTLWKFACI